MNNHWFRLWHDMPTDPKFRTIARLSGEILSLVLSVYMLLLVSASRNINRGNFDVTQEDIASALDVTELQVGAILSAMQGRLLKLNYLTGWNKRQPKAEDGGNPVTGAKSARERKQTQRAREKFERERGNDDEDDDVTKSHESSQGVTVEEEEIRVPTTTTTTSSSSSSSAVNYLDLEGFEHPFQMTNDWYPSQTFIDSIVELGYPDPSKQDFKKCLMEFHHYWSMRVNDLRSQQRWEHTLLRSLDFFESNKSTVKAGTSKKGSGSNKHKSAAAVMYGG